jgi:hypothetical protein
VVGGLVVVVDMKQFVAVAVVLALCSVANALLRCQNFDTLVAGSVYSNTTGFLPGRYITQQPVRMDGMKPTSSTPCSIPWGQTIKGVRGRGKRINTCLTLTLMWRFDLLVMSCLHACVVLCWVGLCCVGLGWLPR